MRIVRRTSASGWTGKKTEKTTNRHCVRTPVRERKSTAMVSTFLVSRRHHPLRGETKPCWMLVAAKDRTVDPFVTAGRPNGTGLGLTLARRIAEEHGGSVRLEESNREWTVFTLSLTKNRSLPLEELKSDRAASKPTAICGLLSKNQQTEMAADGNEKAEPRKNDGGNVEDIRATAGSEPH